MNQIPEPSYLNEALIYVDGELHFRIRPREHFRTARGWNMWNAKFAGKRAGREMPNGEYRQVMLGGVRFLEHRVIAAMFGMDVSQHIDHIDGNGLNNLVANLRPASVQENTKNNRGWSKKQSRVGIHQKTNGSWVAYIRDTGKHRHLGTYATEAAATEARIAAEKQHYGAFAVSLSRPEFLHSVAAARGVEIDQREHA